MAVAVAKIKIIFKSIFIALVLGILIISSVVLIRTSNVRLPHKVPPCLKNDSDYISDSRGLFKRLAEAIKFQTVSWATHKYNITELDRFKNFVIKSYPLIHSSKFISYEVVNELSLLYTVRGKNENLLPYMMCAHMDVVPVDEKQWSVPPFAGVIKNNTLYGRGTLDDKGNLLGILEAVEYMLENDIQPERGFYIGFGHDEEVLGSDGAAHIAKLLETRGVKLLYLLDEGTFIVHNMIIGVDSPVGLVGISEKGYLTLKLSVETNPGHSSMPSNEQAISILAKALSKLNIYTQPNMFGHGPEKEMLVQAAPYARFPFRMLFSNLWLFSPLVSWVMSLNPISNSNIRTTTAFTMINGGIKENVLPSSAYALINHRVHPAQSISEVVEIDKAVINDERVQVEVIQSANAHPFSPHDENSFGYQVIKKTVAQFVPDLAVLPVCMVANTDTRWYLNLTDSLYRFSVFDLDKSETGIIHGHDERITLDSYERVVNFYFHIIKNSDSEFIKKKDIHVEL